MSSASNRRRAVVVGGGVIGLTTALELARRGRKVRVVAEAFHPDITSTAAGASAYPFFDTDPPAVLALWKRAYGWYRARAEEATPGVTLAGGTHFYREPQPHPRWADHVGGVRRPPSLLPGTADGHILEDAPMIDMRTYLPWLMETLAETGVTLDTGAVGSLTEVANGASVVVNCAGLGAGELSGDDTLVPIRGQLVLVDNPGLDRYLSIESADGVNGTYVFPHAERCAVGGTYHEGETDTTPDEATTERILTDARRHVPDLAGAGVRSVVVGLRPHRPAGFRTEVDAALSTDETTVVHNYGHGGRGVTFAPACAEVVADLAATP